MSDATAGISSPRALRRCARGIEGESLLADVHEPS
jgi:hypothetical protein